MTQVTTGELPRRRWWVLPLVLTVIIAALIGGSVLIHRWRQPGRLCAEARAFMEKDDDKNAALCLQRALQLSPVHPEATRLMVELAEKLNLSSVVAWREQLSRLDPASTEERGAWLESALRFGRVSSAERAIEQAPEAFRKTAGYEEARGLVAISKGKVAEAEAAFSEALNRDPSRESFQLNLALARIQLADPRKRSDGEAALRKLAEGGSQETAARRALVRLDIRRNRFAEAAEMNKGLLASEAVEITDRLTQLDLALALRDSGFPSMLAQTRAIASKRPRDLAVLLNWSRDHLDVGDPVAWAKTLPPAVFDSESVAGAWAEFLAAAQDWRALEEFAQKEQAWATGEHMRQAFLSLAAEKLKKADLSIIAWRRAVQLGARTRESAMAIAYFAHRAGWRVQLIDALWAAAEVDGGEWALGILHRLHAEDGETRGMLRVAERFVAINPSDLRAQNNAAALRLLLDRSDNGALLTARSLHQKDPNNAIFTSTFAYALHLSGKSEEALKLLEGLSPEDKQRPEVALYHAVLLAARNRSNEAVTAAAIAQKAPMLPEEKRLLEQIIRK